MTERTATPPLMAMTLAAALVLHVLFWPIVMIDVGNDYVPWLRHIADTGPLAAFSKPFASYNPPYLYLLAMVSPLYGLLPGPTLIKLVSVAGTIALAVAAFGLLQTLGVKHAARWAAVILIMPSTTLNAALLGQSDAIWAAPCIAALDAAVGRRHRVMLFWCGIALAIKIQSVLFAPFVIALLIKRRVPLWQWLIVPGTYAALLSPACLLGWPALDLVTIYFRQAGSFPALSLNAPNLWFIVQVLMPAEAPRLSGLAIAAAIGATAYYIARFSAGMPNGHRLLPIALLAPMMTAGLLPHMHERYFFLADIIAFLWAVTSGGRRKWLVAILVQAGSTLAVFAYAAGLPILVVLGFAAMVSATYIVAMELLQPAANDNPIVARAV